MVYGYPLALVQLKGSPRCATRLPIQRQALRTRGGEEKQAVNTLFKRVITAAITAPGVIALLFFAKRDNFPWAVGLFLAISVTIGTAEFCHIIENYGIEIRVVPTSLLAGSAFLAYSVLNAQYGYIIGPSMAGLAIII